MSQIVNPRPLVRPASLALTRAGSQTFGLNYGPEQAHRHHDDPDRIGEHPLARQVELGQDAREPRRWSGCTAPVLGAPSW